MDRSLYYLGNSRSPEQTADMEVLESEGVCIFCPEHIRQRKTVVHEGAHWFITTNDFAYKGAKLHLLVSPKRHVEDLLDLPPGIQDDLWNNLAWIRDEYGLNYYGLGARNGEAEYTGGTIRHIHVHVVVGDPEAEEPVRLKLSSKPKETPPS